MVHQLSSPNEIAAGGNVRIAVCDAKTNRLLELQHAKNLVPNVGLDLDRDLLGGAGTHPDVLAVGTGTGATIEEQTSLVSQVFSRPIDRRIPAGQQITFQMLIGQSEANGNTLSEIGLLAGSVLVGRALIPVPIPKTVAIQVTIFYELRLRAE